MPALCSRLSAAVGILVLSLALPCIEGASPGAKPSSNSAGDPTANSPVLPDVSADGLVDGESACGPGITGTWTGSATTDGDGEVEVSPLTLFLTQSGSNVTGSFEIPADDPQCGLLEEGPVSGSVAGNLFSFELDLPERDPDTCEILCLTTSLLSLAINENEMGGSTRVSSCLDPGFRDETQISLMRDCPPPAAVIEALDRLAVSLVQGGPAATEGISLSNQGSALLNFQVEVTTQSGGSWLSVSPTEGQVEPANAMTLRVTADPAALEPGTYSGEVRISNTASGEVVTVPVDMAISRRQQLLRISRTGLTLTAVVGAGITPPPSFRVLNGGLGLAVWRAVASVLGGRNWLSLTLDNGSSSASTSSLVGVQVDPSGLDPGVYYGVVEVAAPEAASSPQFVTVVLNLLPAESKPGPTVVPSGLVFSNRLDAPAQTSAQQVQILNLTASPISFTSSVSTTDGGDWLERSPSEGTVVSSQPTTVEVAVDPGGLAPGIYRGVVDFSFDDDSTRSVNVVLSVVPGDAVSLQRISGAKNGCTRSEVAPVFRTLGGTSPIPAAWPASIEVEVVDDCGLPMTQGSAIVDFTNISSPSLALAPSGDGLWTATWTVPNVTEQSMAGVTVTATDPAGISGSMTQAVAVAPNAAPAPKVSRGGVVHSGSFVKDPLGPGTILSIFGEPGIHLTQVTTTSCSWAHSVLASQSATIERYGVGSTAMACCTRR